jgi:hypothetical protein
VLPLLVIFVPARVYPDLNRREISDWTPQISVAVESLQTGDFIRPDTFIYRQAGLLLGERIWAGLVAAACGFKRLDGVVGPYSISSSMLIYPTMAAELMQSRRGIATVATAFATIGSDQASKAVLARIQPYWPDETNDAGDAQLLEACWGTGAKSRVIKQTDRLKIDRVPVGQRFGIEVIDSVCWRAISAITAT